MGNGDDDGENERAANWMVRMLNQTLNYLDHFARFTQKENVEAVERLLSAHKDLAKFERAQLGTPSEPATTPILGRGSL
jgi:hypothetical protein